MNVERLLALYDRVAEAPDAIARLRRFVLDLAVRGKLVEQDPADEPASELLRRIAAEKARLVKAGVIRKPKPVEIANGCMYALPETWALIPFAEVIIKHLGGGTPSKNNSNYWDGDVPWASVKDVGKSKYLEDTVDRVTEAGLTSSSSNLIESGQLIVVTRMGLGKVSINRIPVAINQDLRALFLSTLISIDYAYNFFLTYGFEGTGLTVKGIKLQELLRIPFPLPPLPEQWRIVAKVDELMALCDWLEAARTTREATRDRLTAASLAGLTATAADADTFRTSARFVLGALPAVTTRPDQIKSLRQTILNLAVRGKLVEQDPMDEPASDLLKRIATEQSSLSRAGPGKTRKPRTELNDDDKPFDLPNGWVWVRFPELGIFARGKSKHRPRNDPALFDGGTHPMIQTGDVARSQGLITTYTAKYNDFGLAQSMKWPKGTMCITIAAHIADSGILDFDACFPDSVVGFRPAPIFENARYFEYFVRTAKANLLEFAPATAQKNINLAILNSVLIPLPPLVEQRRIVAKVDELMAICDRLGASLREGDTSRRRLLDALLHEALHHGALVPAAEALEAAGCIDFKQQVAVCKGTRLTAPGPATRERD